MGTNCIRSCFKIDTSPLQGLAQAEFIPWPLILDTRLWPPKLYTNPHFWSQVFRSRLIFDTRLLRPKLCTWISFRNWNSFTWNKDILLTACTERLCGGKKMIRKLTNFRSARVYVHPLNTHSSFEISHKRNPLRFARITPLPFERLHLTVYRPWGRGMDLYSIRTFFIFQFPRAFVCFEKKVKPVLSF